MENLLNEAQELYIYTQSIRRDLHRHPEIGFKEIRTAGVAARELSALGLEVTTGVAHTGVVALLEGGKPGPVVLVRADMDALPMSEETGAEYASQTPGCMHACGHDGHVAISLTVAKLLQAHRSELAGTVKFVFQPAEEGVLGPEGMTGAELMVAQGVLENPKPDLALSLHLWNEKPLGWLGIAGGPVMAGAEIIRIKIRGRGGHGAVPQLAADPVLAAAQVITALQSIIARNVAPLQSAVVSIGTIHGGTAFNIIPPEVELTGTVRSFDPDVHSTVLRRLEEIVQGVTRSMGCQAELEVIRISPPVTNSAQVAGRVQQVARKLLPDANVDTAPYLTMGAEDMSFMLEKVDGCYFFIGSANPEKGLDYAHHHPKFDFDEAALPRAAALMAGAVLDFLK